MCSAVLFRLQVFIGSMSGGKLIDHGGSSFELVRRFASIEDLHHCCSRMHAQEVCNRLFGMGRQKPQVNRMKNRSTLSIELALSEPSTVLQLVPLSLSRSGRHEREV